VVSSDKTCLHDALSCDDETCENVPGFVNVFLSPNEPRHPLLFVILESNLEPLMPVVRESPPLDPEKVLNIRKG